MNPTTRTSSAAGLLRALCLCLALLSADSASAQEHPTPITGRRLEQLLVDFAEPTESELFEIRALYDETVGTIVPEDCAETSAFFFDSYESNRSHLAKRDALQRTITDQEGALFDAVAEVVADDRRAGVRRAREARERERNLAWSQWVMGCMYLPATQYIDLARMIHDGGYRGDVSPSLLEQFDAALVAQEQRALAESGRFRAATRRAMDAYAEIAMELGLPQAGPAGDEAREGFFERMTQEMRRREPEALLVLAANLSANIAAAREIAPLLTERAACELRSELAVRSMGGTPWAFDTAVRRLMPWSEQVWDRARGVLVDSLVRSAALSDEVRASLEASDLAWRRERVAIVERLVQICSKSSPRELHTAAEDWESGGTVPKDGAMRDITALARELICADQRFHRAVAAALDPAVRDRYFEPAKVDREGERGLVAEPLVLRLRATGEDTDGDVADPAEVEQVVTLDHREAPYELWNGRPSAPSAGSLLNLFRGIGVSEESGPLIESTTLAWREAEWDAKVEPLAAELRSALERVWARPEGSAPVLDPEAFAAARALRWKLVDAVFAADAELARMLSAVLQWPHDGPEILLLRFERLPCTPQKGMFPDRHPSLATVLRRARVSPETARAILESSREAMKALADEIPPRVRESIGFTERIQLIATNQDEGFDPAEKPNLDQRRLRIDEVKTESATRSIAFGERVGAVLEDAVARAVEDADIRLRMRRAWLEVLWPMVYRLEHCATYQLLAAQEIVGLTESQAAAIDALRAEYDAVYDRHCDESRRLETEGLAPGRRDDVDVGRWYVRVRWLEERRADLAEWVRSDLRRILGPQHTQRIAGLALKTPERIERRRAMDLGGGYWYE